MSKKVSNLDFLGKYQAHNLDVKTIPWDEEPQYMGFSVLRKYPRDKGFIPAITSLGLDDTVVLIRVGCFFSNNTTEKTPFIVTVSKHSQYKYSHFGINFEDDNAPTKTSLEASELSKQPIDLEENSRYFLLEDESIFDEKNKKTVSLNEIVDDIYKEHIETISSRKAVIFKTKLNIKQSISEKIIPEAIRYFKYLLKAFGRELSSGPGLVGIHEPYTFKQLETDYPYSFPFFKTDVRISVLTICWISTFTVFIWYYIPIIKSMNETFSLAVVILVFILFEYIIPYIFFKIINTLIWLRFKLDTTSIKYN
jgi:hypothetical protein